MDTATATEKIQPLEIVLKEQQDSGRKLDPNKMCKFTLTVPETDVPKMYAFMHSDTFERAEAARKANFNDYYKSLEVAMNWAMHHDCSGAAVFARLLASLYNGNRVQMDASRIVFTLDAENFEHAMNVIRLCKETSREPHTFFKNGNDLFEAMIKKWGFEKRRRNS